MIAAMAGMFTAMGIRQNAAFGVQATNQSMMGLMNRMHGNMTPRQIRFAAAQGAQMEIQNAMNRVNYLAASVWEDAAREQLKKDLERERERNRSWYA